MPVGSITTWNLDRGFGFISDDQTPRGRDTFAHISAFDGIAPQVGDVYEYGLEEGRDGRPRAVDLRRIDRVGFDA